MTPLSAFFLAALAALPGSAFAGGANDGPSAEEIAQFEALQRHTNNQNGVSALAVTNPGAVNPHPSATAAPVVTTLGVVTPPPTTVPPPNTGPTNPPPEGGANPPPPDEEKQRAEQFDKEFGTGVYEKIGAFTDHCFYRDGCDRLAAAGVIDAAYKYIDLQTDVRDNGLAKESPQYRVRNDLIKRDLRSAIDVIRPKEGAPALPYQAEFVAATEPVVKVILPEPKPEPVKPVGPADGPGGGATAGSNGGDSALPAKGQQAYNQAVREAPSLGSTAAGAAGAFASPAEWLMGGSLSPLASVASNAAATDAPGANAAAIAAAQNGAAAVDPARQSADYANSARHSLSVGDPRAAVASLREAVARNPNDAKALSLLSMAHNRLKDYHSALEAAQEGLRLAPNNPALLDSQAYAYNGLKNYKAALAAADLALKANPRDALAHYNRAIALAGLGDREGMLDALRAAAAISPRFAPYVVAAEEMPAGNFNFLTPGGKPAARAALEAPHAPFLTTSRLGLAGGAAALAVVALLAASAGKKAAPAPAAAPRREEPSHGLLAGKYVLGRKLGAGGMGMVFEGRDRTLERRVAVKRMREEIRWDERERQRFLTEARVVAKLRHPNVVNILEIAEEAGEVYLIFEFLEGRTLKDVLTQQGRLSFRKARELFRGIAAALDYAQANGVIHRDLKPANVMVDERGEPRVMDFGIARVAEEAVSRHCATRTTTIVGTPAYMAPEQEQGVTRKESDVFSMAVCFYEALTGQRPYAGTGGGMLMNKIKKLYTPASQAAAGLPPGLDAVFARAFDPDPLKRYPSAGAFLRDLEALE